MKKLFYILILFLFTGATEKGEVTIYPRSFYAEMKALENPPKITAAAAVQTASNNANAVTSLSVTISSSGSNNLLVVSIYMPASRTLTSVTDNQSNTYTLGSGLLTGGTAAIRIYQSYTVCVSGVTSVTVTPSASTSFSVIVDEYSGNATSSVLDVSGTGAGTGTAVACGTFTPSASGKLIVSTLIGYAANNPGWTAGSGYTLYGSDVDAGFEIMRSQYDLSGTTSETAPATVSYAVLDEYATIARAYNLAAGTNTTNFFFKP